MSDRRGEGKTNFFSQGREKYSHEERDSKGNAVGRPKEEKKAAAEKSGYSIFSHNQEPEEKPKDERKGKKH